MSVLCQFYVSSMAALGQFYVSSMSVVMPHASPPSVGRRGCAPPVPVLEMSLMPPQVVGALVAAVSPLVRGACSRRGRRPTWHGGARRGGGVGSLHKS